MDHTERNNTLLQVLLWISVIGALNWGLVGFFNWDLIRAIFGNSASTDSSAFSRVLYAIVGLAGLGLAALAPRLRRAAGDVRRPSTPAEART
jgi:uncharacterized membrane protein YuzA (DUF378 family)